MNKTGDLRASVIIPVYNGESSIADCLEALLRQDYARSDYEVIVVDDGSTDGTGDVISRYAGSRTPWIRNVKQTNQGPAAARNHGAQLAAGNFLLFTDSDCSPEPDWITQMVGPLLADPGLAAVKGAYKTRQTSLAARFAQLEFEERYAKLESRADIDFVDSYSAAVRSDVFREIGGFDTSFPTANNEDVEFSYRMARFGHRMAFTPLAIVYHIHPNTLWKYFKAKFGRAYWRMAVYKSFPEKMGSDSYTPQSLKLQILAVFLALSGVLATPFWPPSLFVVIPAAAIFALSCLPFIGTCFHISFLGRAGEFIRRFVEEDCFATLLRRIGSFPPVKFLVRIPGRLASAAGNLLGKIHRMAFAAVRSRAVRLLWGGIREGFVFLAKGLMGAILSLIRFCVFCRLTFRRFLQAAGRFLCAVAGHPVVVRVCKWANSIATSRLGMLLMTPLWLFVRALVMGLGVLWGMQAKSASKGRFSQVVLLMLADAACFALALLAGSYATERLGLLLPHQSAGDLVRSCLPHLPLMFVLVWLVFALSGLYKTYRGLSEITEFAILAKALLVLAVMGYAVGTMVGLHHNPFLAGLTGVLALAFLGIERGWLRPRFNRAGAQDDVREDLMVLIIGTGEVARLILQRIRGNARMHVRVIGLVAAEPGAGIDEISGCPVLGDLHELGRLVRENHVKDVFVALPGAPQEVVMDIVHRHSFRNDVRFHVVSNLCDLISAEVDIASGESIPIVHLRNESLALLHVAVKRVFDLVVALIVITTALPFLGLIVIAIKLDSPGPALFRQERVGKNGRRFRIFKFRTMREDTDCYAYSPTSVADTRVTGLGAFLRKTSLDEFPQLLNVLRGEMSFVGPRPEMPFIVEGYSEWQRQRLTVKPGITGLWQIMGRKDLPLHENIEYDFYYIKNQSLLLDLSILIKTIPVILRRDGAY